VPDQLAKDAPLCGSRQYRVVGKKEYAISEAGRLIRSKAKATTNLPVGASMDELDGRENPLGEIS
jgi:hypothetical protein